MLKKGKLHYGCFLVSVCCDTCKKAVLKTNISFNTDGIGYQDESAIKVSMASKLEQEEIHFCCKCGHKITI